MKTTKILILLLLALSLVACSFTVNVPTVYTGSTETFEISEEPVSDASPNQVDIEMGAGKLNIEAGSSKLVEGTITYNVDSWKPEITRKSNGIVISQNNTSNVGVPDGNIKNNWDLKFGDMPIDLTLSTGAYDGNLDLSGLSIANLSISDGASKTKVIFNTLNPVKMDRLTYKTGASDVELLGLGNANVSDISFDSGVGSYTLDFSGDVKDDISVRIQSGMSDITIVIPENVRAQIAFSSGLSNIDAKGTWTISNNTYECGTSGPLITVNLDMALGNLRLKQE